ncbi:hypothetical protein [Methylomonas rivi]|uniref:Uncharacterized protein n=1 Tax=Methylomonas rivi TaxID=2952226 RepID=A0ABT1U323_9GAMM|nr:hypothetical protein [Methylomonas sp. WSC-6]MBS4049868.1 hypothetical protein [Methylomonas sp.]MCQ8128202.1 hypothetical protein [Methylomonas sp. WSC-6]
MSEIPPISPSPVLPIVHKVEREKERDRDKGSRKPKGGSGADRQSPQNEQAAQHIDEIV